KGMLNADAVLARLASSDERLRRTALEILQKHIEWAEPARELLSRRIGNPGITQEEETGLRDLILAFQAQKLVQELVAQRLIKADVSVGRRVFLLETIGQSSLPKLPSIWSEALA